jgi:enterochelin esterase-like enzyme
LHIDQLTHADLLLINDGQDMKEMGLVSILEKLYSTRSILPLVVVAIHAGKERKMEYGVASQPDFKGRGAKAAQYGFFILGELLPFIVQKFSFISFGKKAFAGFSLGGLSAMDIAWDQPEIFNISGVFSGSFWWRSLDQSEKNYDDDIHRIMHQVVRKGSYKPGLKFFFQCGNKDETRDRNKNGIIDSIDDTIDLIKELEKKGWLTGKDIRYIELKDGRHDVLTWGQAMPEFLTWAFADT